MSDQRNDSTANDSRATDFVFGELSPEETQRFQRELEQSPELQTEVASIREAVAAVQAELVTDSRGVNEAGRRQIEVAISGDSTKAPPPVNAVQPPTTDGTNTRRALIGLAVAASVLVIGVLAIPAWRGPQAVTNVQPTIDAADVGERSTRSEVSGVDDALDLVAEPPSNEPPSNETAFGMKTNSPGDSRLRDLDSGAEQSAGSQAAATSDVSGVVAGLPTSDLNVTLESEMASPSGEPSDSPKLSAAKDRIGSTTLETATGGIAAAEGEARGTATDLSRQKAKTLDSKKQYYDAFGIAANESLSQTSQGDRAKNDGIAMEGVRPAAPKAETASLALLGRNAAQSRTGPMRLGAAVDGEMKMGEDATLGRGPGMPGDQHEPITDNPFKKVIDSPLSTFSIDVDTASYAKVRMYLMQHQMLPRPDAVRIEELLNYFTYDYEPPAETDEHPFAATVSVAQCPWNAKHRLARVAIKGKVIEKERPASNLVFLLDVSGSMNHSNKLPLVVEGMKMLTEQLGENDSVAIVVYAGAAGLVLDSTCGDEKETILSALERLRAGGSTNGGQGIQLAYDTARDNFITGGTNRVILCTDGDFNVGVTGTDQLVRIAEQNAKGNIFLTVLGFGMGNHNDAMMEQISNKGNGNYAFIDSKKEAEKVLVEQMGGTLVTIAKDVKIQIDFNRKEVSAYRLIGYENRILAAQDFNDDTKDAGEIGAGHTVTAMYELVPAGGEIDVDIPTVDESRYLKKTKLSKQADNGELLTLKLRYKQPTGTESTLIEVPVKDEGKSFSAMDADFKFAAAVASFGMLLRNSPYKGDATFAAVEEIAGDVGEDKKARRTEFLEMVVRAKQLSGEQ